MYRHTRPQNVENFGTESEKAFLAAMMIRWKSKQWDRNSYLKEVTYKSSACQFSS